MSKNKVSNEMIINKALFSQRFFAFILDVIFVFLIMSIISIPILSTNNNITRLNEENRANIEYARSGEMDFQTYISKTIEINHDLARERGLITIISILLSIGYFIIYPFYRNGQTLGKKILRIQIVSVSEEKKLTMNNFAIRGILINSILLSMLTFSLALLASREVYTFGIFIFEGIQILFLLICFIGIAVKIDGRGLHDILAGTMVIRKQESIKEEK